MEYAREEIEFALVQQRQRKLGLDMELAKGVNPDLIAKNVERCDAQIAVLEAQLEKFPPVDAVAEEAAALAADRKRQIQVENAAAAILIADPEVDTSELEKSLAESVREKEDGGFDT